MKGVGLTLILCLSALASHAKTPGPDRPYLTVDVGLSLFGGG